jgi:uncharacterized protein
MNGVIALIAGLLFGVGLNLAHMTDPEVVIGFLDVAGQWNPQLVFVLGGALGTALIGFRVVGMEGQSWFGGARMMPTKKDIDAQLVGGAGLFGIGWGLVGYCPGPGIAALTHGAVDPAWFMLGMVAGMIGYGLRTHLNAGVSP